jgi:hypothetical protein
VRSAPFCDPQQIRAIAAFGELAARGGQFCVCAIREGPQALANLEREQLIVKAAATVPLDPARGMVRLAVYPTGNDFISSLRSACALWFPFMASS